MKAQVLQRDYILMSQRIVTKNVLFRISRLQMGADERDGIPKGKIHFKYEIGL